MQKIIEALALPTPLKAYTMELAPQTVPSLARRQW